MPLPDIYATRKAPQKLLHELEVKHNFNILDELICVYKSQKDVYDLLMVKLRQAIANNLLHTQAQNGAFTDEERKILADALGTQVDILGKLLSYAYPKMKTQEVKIDDQRKITWQINVPPVELPGAQPVMLDIPHQQLLLDAKEAVPVKKRAGRPKGAKNKESKSVTKRDSAVHSLAS